MTDISRRQAIMAIVGVTASGCVGAEEKRNVVDYGADPEGIADSTFAIQSALDAGGRVVIPSGNYKVSQIKIPSNVIVDMRRGVRIERMPGNGSVLFFDNSENAHVFCRGAVLDGSAPATGNGTHTVKMLGTKGCTLWGANVVGASKAGKDGIYLGYGNGPCVNSYIGGGSVVGALRNGISVVAAHACTIRNVEVVGSTGSPGAGVDVEANQYGDVDGITLANIHAHDNQGIGIAVIFGNNVYIKKANCHNNGSHGIAVSSGGAQFNDGVARPVDKRTITGFDPLTGRIFVDTTELPEGCIVQFVGDEPATLQQTVRYIVTTVGDGFVKVGASTSNGEISSFSDAGGQCYLYTFVEGQASNVIIDRAKCLDNAADKEISVGLAVNTVVKNSEVTGNTIGINASFSRNTTIRDNVIVDSIYGINASTATNLTVKNNVSTQNRYDYVTGNYQ